MKLSFNRPYKSITRFEPFELSSFTVLTGVNGAGKSHLLEALENGAITVEGIPPNQPHGFRPIRRFDSSSLVPQDTGAFSGAQISQEQAGFWSEISQQKEQFVESFRESLRQFGIPRLESLSVKKALALKTEDLVSLGVPAGQAAVIAVSIAQSAAAVEQNLTSNFVRNDPQNRVRLMSTIAKTAKVPIFAMDTDDFFGEFPKNWQPVDLFQQSFARLFSAYQRHWYQNQVRETAKTKGAEVSFLTDDEFLQKHGAAPWEFLNEILEVAELDFRINAPYAWDDRPYEPILTDEKRGIRIKFNDLSSGERILMSFALCLYHAKDPNSTAEFPKLLLFDEIDAPLHPSMTRSLLRTIGTTLVQQHGIQVILTTHSPSTVALAPDHSIFVMHKQGPDRIGITSKDAALGILTSGVPTLSVNYENRRQVFVESKHDVSYYSKLYELAKPALEPEISLSFIASGVRGIGDCEQVKSVVNSLVTAGNRTVVGVIDWDGKNGSSESIFVAGENERYSIENFILDPLLLGLFLLREKFLTAEEVRLHEQAKYTRALEFSQGELQGLVNFVVGKVAERLAKGGDDEVVEFKYSGGLSTTVPGWFARVQGHTLESTLKDVFPPLLRYTKESELKLAIVQKVLDDYPQLVPASLVALFRRIQGVRVRDGAIVAATDLA